MTLDQTRILDTQRALAAVSVILAAIALGCSNNTGQDSANVTAGEGEHAHEEGGEHGHREGGEHGRGERGEHDRDGQGHHGHGEEGEESGTELALTETYDKVRNGARLVLAYHTESNSFKGTVENTTENILERVRVEVHLSNGKELGPTTPGDLKPGEKREITLTPESQGFEGWTTHPEVGSGEHGHGEEEEHARRK